MMAMRTRPIVAALFSALILSAATSYAQPPASGAPPEAAEEAKTRHERGTQLYADGDYKLALIEFERAYELAPNYKALYNIAQTSSQLGRYAAARRAFEQYLKDGGAEIPEKRRADVEKDLASLRGRTALVNVTSNVDGAEIVIDGQVVATTPLTAALLVDAGQHTIEARKPGRITSSRPVTLAGTDEVKIEFDLPEEPVPVAPTVLAPIRETTIIQAPESSYTWVGWVLAGTFLAGATATGIVTLSFSSDLDAARNEPLQPDQTEESKRAELDDAQQRARSTAITTDVLGGAAILTAGVTLVFTILEATSDKKDDKPAAGVSVGVTGGPGNILVYGQF